MQKVKQIHPQWLQKPVYKKVMSFLEQSGHQAKFVGGCVRDTLLNRPVKDIDIATTERPEDLINRKLDNQSIKIIPTGLKHGTVTILCDGQSFEVTTLRKDIETDGRHAKVAYTDSWSIDAQRRDFTINALYMDVDGYIDDYVNGLQDIQIPRIRFIGNPEQRIEEDVLRILRFFRFLSYYGQVSLEEEFENLDAESLKACLKKLELLPQLSRERIQSEISKILETPNPKPIMNLMYEDQVWESIMPPGYQKENLDVLLELEQNISWVRRFGALYIGKIDKKESISRYLCLSRTEKQTLRFWLSGGHEQIKLDDNLYIQKILYFKGIDYCSELIYYSWILNREDKIKQKSLQRLEEIKNWKKPNFPVTGQDVIELGVEPGQKLGQILSITENWWVEGCFVKNREECLKKLSEIKSSMT